jgi:hypothetical protein
MEIEINGLKYRQKEQNKSQIARQSSMSIMLSSMAMMLGDYGVSKRERKNPKVNIIEEFKLIQEKKSNLSRKDREWVVFQFNRNFKLVTPK